MAEDYKERIKLMALDEETFVRLTMRGKLRARDVLWRQVIVRPVLIKNERHLQFSYFNDKTEPFSPVLRHGILKQRMADVLTDAFRALVLRIMGYKTDVVEFVSSEHTDKNLLIRAVRWESG